MRQFVASRQYSFLLHSGLLGEKIIKLPGEEIMNKSDKDTRKIAAYIRVSTQRQANEGDSLEAQEHRLKCWVEANHPADELEVYIERGKSGKNQNRPELQRLKDNIRRNQVKTVVCVKLDRITRSLLDFAELWNFFQEHDVEFTSLAENVDTSSPMGKAMLMIIMVFAQLEREVTGERTRVTMQDRTRRGLWNGAAPYGYRASKDGALEIDRDWATIIRNNFFDKFEEVGSAGQVQKHLLEVGIKTPRRETNDGNCVGGKCFSKQQVLRVLRNPAYAGDIVWGGVTQTECHEAIVSREQFDRVQTKLTENSVTTSNNTRPRGRTYLLRGLVHCRCGAVMTPKSANGRSAKYFYYECTRKTHGSRAACSAKGVPAEPLEEAVVDRIKEIGTNVETRKKIVSEALKLVDVESQSASEKFQRLKNQLSAVKSEIGRLVSAVKDTSAPAAIIAELSRLETEEVRLQAQKDELSQQKQPWDEITASARDFIENWSSVSELIDFAPSGGRFQLIQRMVKKLELISDSENVNSGTYRIVLNPGFAAGPNEKEDSELTESSLVLHVSEKAPRADAQRNFFGVARPAFLQAETR